MKLFLKSTGGYLLVECCAKERLNNWKKLRLLGLSDHDCLRRNGVVLSSQEKYQLSYCCHIVLVADAVSFITFFNLKSL